MTLSQLPRAETVLEQLCLPLKQGSQLCDAPMRRIDSHLCELKQLGLYNRSIAVGPVVISRGYGVDGPNDSREVIQAAVSTAHGTSAVFWDSEDYSLYKKEDDFLREAFIRARPLRECAPAVRAMVWPHAEQLVFEMLADCELIRKK